MNASSDRFGQLAGHTILVVEDEYFLGDDVAAALSGIGAKVIGPLNDLEQAMQAVSENALAGAALDVNVRGQTIYPLAQELQSRGVPFIFMTGYGRDAIPREYQHVRRCEKPFDVKELVSEMATLVLAPR
jgi:DNA-binding response OmpR family regulator